MSRIVIVLAAVIAVLFSAFVPASAYAAGAVAPTVGVDASTGDEMSVFHGTASHFTAGGTVKVTITVDGKPYAGSYTKTHTAAADGSFAWSWIWTEGDPYGSYTFTFTDPTGAATGIGITINHGDPPTPAAGTHLMVDAGSTPSLATMQTWQQDGNAPYNAIGVYVPVGIPNADDRHDKTQANLTPSWVQGVQSGGWHVLPIYVGLQAPSSCQQPAPGTFHAMSGDPAGAMAQGVAAADDAVASANRLGIASGVPLVYDMESYQAGCGAAVQSFLAGWSARLHQADRLSAVYGPVRSAATDLAGAGATDATYVLPDAFWAASNNRSASTAVTNLPRPGWKIANQFLWGVDRSFGESAKVNVDESAVDDDAWRLPAPSSKPDTAGPIVKMAGGTPVLTRHAKASFAWSGVDARSGLAAYQVRTRVTQGGKPAAAWGAPTRIAATTSGLSALKLAKGQQGCVQVRGVDAAGNVSAWTAPACTSRLADDRSAKPAKASKKRWHRVHRRGAYGKTLTTSTRGHAVLRLGHAAPGRLGLVHSGRGALVVKVGKHRLGAVRGTGTTWVDIPRAGAVTVTASKAHASVDGFVLMPR